MFFLKLASVICGFYQRSFLFFHFVSFLRSLVAHKFPVFLFFNNVAASLYWFCLGFEAYKYKDRLKKIGSVNMKYGMIFLSSCTVLLTIFFANSFICKALQEIAMTFLMLAVYYRDINASINILNQGLKLLNV